MNLVTPESTTNAQYKVQNSGITNSDLIVMLSMDWQITSHDSRSEVSPSTEHGPP